MGCGDETPIVPVLKVISGLISQEFENYVEVKKYSEEAITKMFFGILDLKTNEEKLFQDMMNYEYPTFTSIEVKDGNLKYEDFASFFKFLAQEEGWNGALKEEALKSVFTKSAINDKWTVEALITYVKNITNTILAETRYEMKQRKLLVGGFYVMFKKSPEVVKEYEPKLKDLVAKNQEICTKLLTGADPKGMKKDDPKLFDLMCQISCYIPVVKVTENYRILVPFFHTSIDADADGYINQQDLVTYITQLAAEVESTLGIEKRE